MRRVGPVRCAVIATFATSAATLMFCSSASAIPISDAVADLGRGGSGGAGLAVLPDGHLLVVAQPQATVGPGVYDVAPGGTMTRVAGCGCTDQGQGNGDGGPAIDAVILDPTDLEPTADGGFLIAQGVVIPPNATVAGGSLVRKVAADGTISTVAGNGEHGHSGDGGPATEAQLGRQISGISATSGGGFLIRDGARVRMVDSDGDISTVAGTGAVGFSGDGGPAIEATIGDSGDIDATPEGGFLIADGRNCRVREVAADGTINTVAGNGATITDQGETYCDLLYGSSKPFVEGTPALMTPIHLGDVEALPDGGFLVSTLWYILRSSPDGVLSRVAGIGYGGQEGFGCPVSDVPLAGVITLASAGETVYYTDLSGLGGGTDRTMLRSISDGVVTGCSLIGIDGSAKGDEIEGGQYREKVQAGAAADEVDGGSGKDNLIGEGGKDELDAGGGADKVSGGPGKDEIDVAGGGKDSVRCGPGRDVVKAGANDRTSEDCEIVR